MPSKPCQASWGLQKPTAGMAPEERLVRLTKRSLRLFVHDTVGLPDGEPPVVLPGPVRGPDLFGHRHHLLSKDDRLLDRLFDEEPPPRVSCHHLGGDVERRDDSVLGGEVEVSIMNASLNRGWSTDPVPCLTWSIEPCEKAARTLWVDWVAKIVGPAAPARCIPNLPA